MYILQSEKDSLIYYYTNEACYYLTIAMNELFNFSIGILINYNDSEQFKYRKYPELTHTFVYNYSHSMVSDIKGLRTQNEMLYDFDFPSLKYI